jgi:inorganic triphosphatase YgiF
MSETELKIHIGKDDLAEVSRILARLSHSDPEAELLTATYFDTPTLTLFKRGYTFRVRREGNRPVQTLKFEDSNKREGLTRGEWTDLIKTDEPDLEKGKSGRTVRREFGTPRLKPQLTISIHRYTYVIPYADNTRIEAAIDVGEIRIEGTRKRVPITEVELELKVGENAIGLYEIAQSLLHRITGRIEFQSKAARGFAHHKAARPRTFVRLKPPAPKRKETLGQVLQAVARRYFAQFYGNVPAVEDDDEEGIHQMRVALRRMRAVLNALEDYVAPVHFKSVNRKLKNLLQSLGDSRNWFVVGEHIKRVPELALRRTVAHRRLIEAVEAKWHRANEDAKTSVQAPEHAMTWLELLRWFEMAGQANGGQSPKLRAAVKEAVNDILDRQFRRVHKRAQKFERLTTAERHKLRIACKNLRYTIDLFAGVYPKGKVKDFLRNLRRVQDCLGYLNDVRMARQLLTRPGFPRREALAAGEALGWLEKDANARLADIHQDVKRLVKSKPFW